MNGEKSRRAPGIRYFEKFEKQYEKLLQRELGKARNAIKEMFVTYSRKKYKSINLDRRFYKLLVDLVSRFRQGKSEKTY